MKRLLVGCLLALTLLLGSWQQASAYFKSQFGVGLQWNIECGGNKFGWGLYNSSGLPGGQGAWPGMYPAMSYGMGGMYNGYPIVDASTAPATTAPATVTPAPATGSTPAATSTTPSGVKPVAGSVPTQQVNYSYETAPAYNYGGYNYNSYNYGNYGYGSTGYGYNYGYQTPSYWYGN